MRYAALLLTLTVVACGGSPTSPSGATEAGTWTVNGESFRASSNGLGATRTGGTLGLTAAECGRGAFLGMMIRAANMSAPATYAVGDGDGMASVSWTPDARTGASASEAWAAPGLPRVVGGVLVRGGSGSVTITGISGEWVSGTFAVEVAPNPGNQDTAMKTVQGTFELSFREGTIC